MDTLAKRLVCPGETTQPGWWTRTAPAASNKVTVLTVTSLVPAFVSTHLAKPVLTLAPGNPPADRMVARATPLSPATSAATAAAFVIHMLRRPFMTSSFGWGGRHSVWTAVGFVSWAFEASVQCSMRARARAALRGGATVCGVKALAVDTEAVAEPGDAAADHAVSEIRERPA